MNKNNFAVTPPMGWNSYDYYDTTVNEAQIRANAEYMAKHLKKYGWEYVVIDIEWYSNDAGTQRDKYQYIPFGDDEMDEYSRFQPSPKRFPSSADGTGFTKLAEFQERQQSSIVRYWVQQRLQTRSQMQTLSVSGIRICMV